MIDIFEQSYSNALYYTFIVKKIGLTFTISFAGYSPFALADSAALLLHLQTYFVNSFQILETERQGEPINLETVYQDCINLEDGASYIFNTVNHILNENLIANNQDLVDDPLEYDSDNGLEIFINGSIPAPGNFLITSYNKLLGDFTESPISKIGIRNTFVSVFGDLFVPANFEIYTPLGYKFGEFSINRWSDFSETSQLFGTPAQVTCASFTIAEPNLYNSSHYLYEIAFTTINAPTPVYLETGILAAIFTIDGKEYRGIVQGNITDGIYLTRNWFSNKPLLDAIFNYASFIENDIYDLDTQICKFKIVLYYI